MKNNKQMTKYYESQLKELADRHSLSKQELCVFREINDRVNKKKGFAWASINTMCRAIKVSRRTFQRGINKLLSLGLITVEARMTCYDEANGHYVKGQTSNIYRLVIDTVMQAVAEGVNKIQIEKAKRIDALRKSLSKKSILVEKENRFDIFRRAILSHLTRGGVSV
jgi:DNA-binding transcriptional regulator YhcF (GntR family)